MKQKVDVFDLIPEPVQDENDDENNEPAGFDPSILAKYEEIFTILENQYIEEDEVDFDTMQEKALK